MGVNENLAVSSASVTYDNLFVVGSGIPIVNDEATIVSGAGSLVRGTVLGKITKGAITAAAASGNTGNGTCGSMSMGAAAKVGAYTLKATAATIFSIFDPEGYRLPDLTVGTAYIGPINLTITAGATAFVAGDSFTVTVAAGSGYYKTVNSANVDGSQNAYAILAGDVDATSAAVVTSMYLTGEFNGDALTFGGTDTTATHKSTLRGLGIFIKSAQPA